MIFEPVGDALTPKLDQAVIAVDKLIAKSFFAGRFPFFRTIVNKTLEGLSVMVLHVFKIHVRQRPIGFCNFAQIRPKP